MREVRGKREGMVDTIARAREVMKRQDDVVADLDCSLQKPTSLFASIGERLAGKHRSVKEGNRQHTPEDAWQDARRPCPRTSCSSCPTCRKQGSAAVVPALVAQEQKTKRKARQVADAAG